MQKFDCSHLRFTLCCINCRAFPGRFNVPPNAIRHVKRTTLPAWCIAARGTGTRYSRVVIPIVTWPIAAAAVRLLSRLVASGITVRRALARARNGNESRTEKVAVA
jgi:hypothetical protein